MIKFEVSGYPINLPDPETVTFGTALDLEKEMRKAAVNDTDALINVFRCIDINIMDLPLSVVQDIVAHPQFRNWIEKIYNRKPNYDQEVKYLLKRIRALPENEQRNLYETIGNKFKIGEIFL